MTDLINLTSPMPADERRRLGRRVQWLAGATIAYNTVEGIVAITAGSLAGSVALLSFGLDSFVEVLSALVVSWQFAGHGAHHEAREQWALKLVGVAFFALAAWVTIDAITSLLSGSEATTSPVGIAIAVASLIVMPVLTYAKRQVGRQLGSHAVVADSMQTLLCTYLSGVLLLGLVLDATLGWWWADPLAALVIAAVAAREGWQAWNGKDDCC